MMAEADRLRVPGAILLLGPVAEGQYVRRVGDQLVGGTPAGGGGGGIAAESGLPGYEAENKHTARLYLGQAVAAHSSGTGIVGAGAADGTKPAVGLLCETINVGFAGYVQTAGPLVMPSWLNVTGTALLTRGPYFLSIVAGRLTTTAPTVAGQVVQLVGYALSPTQLDIRPAPPIRL